MKQEAILDYWTKDNLVLWPSIILQDIEIPESSKQFLVEIGLPINVDWTLNFNIDLSAIQRIENKSKLFIIGFDDDMPLCIDESTNKVVVVENELNSIRFINSKVESFGICLLLYQQYRIKAIELSEEDVMDVIDLVEKEMTLEDTQAMDYEENYWPVIIEQMRDGLL